MNVQTKHILTGFSGEYSTFDRQFDLGEARRIGFRESEDHVKGYHVAFDRMRAAKIIPTSSVELRDFVC